MKKTTFLSQSAVAMLEFLFIFKMGIWGILVHSRAFGVKTGANSVSFLIIPYTTFGQDVKIKNTQDIKKRTPSGIRACASFSVKRFF